MHGLLPGAIRTRMRTVGTAGLIAITALAVAAPVSADVEREQRGTCEGGSRWELSLEREHGHIDIDLEVDTVQVGRAWKVKLWHEGSRFLTVRRTTDREGEIDISRTRRITPGAIPSGSGPSTPSPATSATGGSASDGGSRRVSAPSERVTARPTMPTGRTAVASLDGPLRPWRAAWIVLACAAASIGCAALTPGPGGGAPTEVPRTPASRSIAPAPSAIAGEDPLGLPRVPGARLVGRASGRDEGLSILELDYRVAADVDTVRQHYRRVMLEHGWTVGDMEVDEAGWEFDASQGTREVEIEIEATNDGTLIEVTVTDPAGVSA